MMIGDDFIPPDERYEPGSHARQFSKADAARYIEHLYPGVSIVALEYLAGGYSSANFSAQLPQEKIVLRFFAGGRDGGEREIWLLRLTDQIEVRTPKILRVLRDGEQMIAAQEFVEGKLLSAVCQDSEQWRENFFAVGRELAKIHAQRFGKSGFFDRNGSVREGGEDFCSSLLAYVRESMQSRVGQRLGWQLAAEVDALVQKHGSIVEDTYSGPRLTHCDFNPKNIIMTSEGQNLRASILDWEFGISGHPLMDFGNFFRFSEDHPEGAEAAFIEGYSLGGETLHPRWADAAKLLDLASMCSFLDGDLESPRLLRTVRMVVNRSIRYLSRA
ncbi:phosphotransferase family protein [Oligoflexus tunisiensis]|uniref:phosphotransferase family protein n=1 Tax=Oligoflexus tunisiensis TaxID=708132 RepID=UPI00114CF599|nr:aminoglycoside phosphotransferase family protein [Oligoflexus tunisiensis]